MDARAAEDADGWFWRRRKAYLADLENRVKQSQKKRRQLPDGFRWAVAVHKMPVWFGGAVIGLKNDLRWEPEWVGDGPEPIQVVQQRSDDPPDVAFRPRHLR